MRPQIVQADQQGHAFRKKGMHVLGDLEDAGVRWILGLAYLKFFSGVSCRPLAERVSRASQARGIHQ